MLRIVSDLFQTALLFFYDCKIGQLISRGYELIDLVVLQHVSDCLVDAGEQALGVALCNCDAVGKSFAEFDEPDGSGKFIANVLSNPKVAAAVQTLLANDGLILGICNGFQALIKSGLLPYGDIEKLNADSPTLFRNNINRHVSHMAKTRITSNKSPWLSSFTCGECHSIAMSHGEGKFVVSDEMARELFANGQVATQYVDEDGDPTMNGVYNINGSSFAIEGITSADGRILGKMGHSERYEEGLFQNIDGNKDQNIFVNGVNYFRQK